MRQTTTNHLARPSTYRRPVARRRRGGSAIIEMALVLPVLLWLAMGTVEYGQYMYLKHAFEAAARDGCRVAITPSCTQAQVVAAMTTTLAASGVAYNGAWAKFYWVTSPGANTAVSDVTVIPAGFGLQVALSAQYSTLPAAVRPLSSISLTGGIGTGKQITGTCSMIRE